jgi:hypothetical protein
MAVTRTNTISLDMLQIHRGYYSYLIVFVFASIGCSGLLARPKSLILGLINMYYPKYLPRLLFHPEDGGSSFL